MTSYPELKMQLKVGTTVLASVNVYHPNLWLFLQNLQGEKSLNNVIMNQFIGGHLPEQHYCLYAKANVHIRIVRSFSNRNLMDFLPSVAHNIQF